MILDDETDRHRMRMVFVRIALHHDLQVVVAAEQGDVEKVEDLIRHAPHQTAFVRNFIREIPQARRDGVWQVVQSWEEAPAKAL